MSKDFGTNVTIKGNRCSRCGHEWRPLKMENVPETCPSCKSPYWQKELIRKTTSQAIKKIRKEEGAKK